MPASLEKMRKVRPIYVRLDGWAQMDDAEITRLCQEGYDSLPNELTRYIEFIEQEVLCPVTIISLGPERNQTILREGPWRP